MARRLGKTLADYLVIAISPALIMTLIGSLVFFLLQVFYRGQWEGRLHYILTLFVFAAVLIGRISIEEGTERATLFAIPLAIATFLGIERFVEIQDVPLAPLSGIINIGLIALIWWCAHKLTWDCTMIDETEPDAGEGVLESAGLDKPAAAKEKGTGLFCPEPGSSGQPPSDKRAPSPFPAPEGTTSREPLPGGWWARWVERRRRPHAPGVWVVYFSLAALPLFGIGQLFIPADSLEGRRYAFSLLCVYVVSGLGLLLTTSFLGLRRYLRQRRLPMPMLMANTWIALGCVLIVVVMGVALLLPRPNAEYAISELPFTFGSPGQHASPYAVDGSGVEEDQPWSRAGPKDDEGSKTHATKPADQNRKTEPRAGKQPGERESPSGKPGEGGKSQPSKKADRGEPQAEKKGKGGQDHSQAGKPDRQKKPQSASPDEEDPDRTKRDGPKQGESSPQAKDSDNDQQPREERRDQQRGSSRSGTQAEKPRDSNSSSAQDGSRFGSEHVTPPPVHGLEVLQSFGQAAEIFKWVFYGAVILLVAYCLWRSRAELLAALQNLLQGWRALWESLFGQRRKAALAAVEERLSRPSFRPFITYADPFATGTAGRYSPEELVKYTFEALEAWAQEHGCPRQPEQTPHEFARTIGQQVPGLADDTLRLAELYCQAAYARGRVSTASAAKLAQLWQNLHGETPVAGA